MNRYFYLKTNFTNGEITPLLNSRVDIQKYNNSCVSLYNFLPSVYGSVSRTPGTEYINTVHDNDYDGRLIPFEASNQSYFLLEFSNGRIRIHADDALLLWSRQLVNNTFDSNINNWTARNTGTGAISYNSGALRLTGTASNNARAYQAFSNPSIEQYTVTFDTTGTVTYRVGTSAGGSQLATGSVTSGTGRTFDFTPLTNDSVVYIEFDAVATVDIDNIILSTPEYHLDHPYTEDELVDVKYAQYNDILILVHENHEPRRLVRRSNDHWQIHTFSDSTTTLSGDPSQVFVEGPYLDVNTSAITMTPGGTSGAVTITASSSVFASTDVGRYFRFRASEENEVETYYTGTGTQVRFDIGFDFSSSSDVAVYVIANTGVKTLQTNPTNYTISGDQVVMAVAPGASDRLLITRANSTDGSWGWGRVTGYTSPTSVTVTTESAFARAIASTDWQLGAFSGTTGYPRAVAFHEQRLWFGGTITNPDFVCASAAGNFSDFSPDNADNTGEIDDDTSFTLSVASARLNKVEWIASRINVLLGSSSAVYELFANGTSGISARSLPSVRKQVERGARSVQGLTINNAVLYTNSEGNRMMELVYSLADDSYVARDISLYAEHLFNSPIRRICFQAEPDSVIWVLKEDGSLVTCTYLKEQEVSAFGRQVLAGTDVRVVDLTSLQAPTRTDMYFIVERTINGLTKKYIEKLRPAFKNQDLQESWFVHSGLSLDNTQSASATLSALSGSGVAFTASSSIFSSGDVGKRFKINGTTYAGVITGYTNATTVTVRLYKTFPSMAIAANSWSLSFTTITGLDHLEGESVTILGDGAVQSNLTVSSGSITLTQPTFYAIIGLGYTSYLETVEFSTETSSGTSFGQLTRLYTAVIDFYETVGGQVGFSSTDENGEAVQMRNVDSTMDASIEMYTGRYQASVSGRYGYEGKIYIEQTQPLPMTVRGMVLKFTISEF